MSGVERARYRTAHQLLEMRDTIATKHRDYFLTATVLRAVCMCVRVFCSRTCTYIHIYIHTSSAERKSFSKVWQENRVDAYIKRNFYVIYVNITNLIEKILKHTHAKLNYL